jgi:hypothetical protein
MFFCHQLWYSWVKNPPLQRPALALDSAATACDQADEEAPRNGCGHTLSMYQMAVPYHINHDDRNKVSPRNI